VKGTHLEGFTNVRTTNATGREQLFLVFGSDGSEQWLEEKHEGKRKK